MKIKLLASYNNNGFILQAGCIMSAADHDPNPNPFFSIEEEIAKQMIFDALAELVDEDNPPINEHLTRGWA